MPLSVERRHEEYETWRESADFLWLSYIGGRDYIESELFLDRYPRETDAVFEGRRERAYLLNYVAGVVDAYVSSVYRRDPIREPDGEEEVSALDGAIASFEENATGDGTSLTDFMKSVATWSVATNHGFVVVDINESGSPYVHQVHPANLLDFSTDRGEFLWALIAESHTDDTDPFSDRVSENRYRLWTPEQWQLFDGDARQVDSGKNKTGRVPLVYVPGSMVNLPIYDIARINKRIFNLCSQLDEILINNTFPQRYIQGEGVEDMQGEAISEDVSPLVLGTSRTLLLPSESNISPGFLAPPDGPAKLHIDERERLVDSIYSLAGLERKDPDSQNTQSGVAKAYDFRETNERLVSLAQTMEAAELEIFSLVADYGVPADVNVTYHKDFYVEDFTMLLDNYLKLQDAALPATVKRRAAMEVALNLAEEATEEERREIRKSVEEMSDASLSSNGSRSRSILNQVNDEVREQPSEEQARNGQR